MDSWICKPELAAIEDQIEAAFGALIGRVQRHGLFGDARRVREQIEFVDQLVALELMLAAEGIGIRALLNFAALEAVALRIRRRWRCGSDR